MARPRLAFVVFAVAILFSMVREWSAPVACARRLLPSTISMSER
ncbi:MAG TPA: hypothetical protein VE377_22205 [Candidatus Dormibacteraeota bacterium]|nr:hypothetical protein [Candidatus Dormibacteraeota bacterium]